MNKWRIILELKIRNDILFDALKEASHMIYGELYPDHPTVIKVREALEGKAEDDDFANKELRD